MSGYSSDFADTPVQTATVDYNAFDLVAANTQLYWPATSGILPPLARLNDFSADDIGLIVTLPPANSATVGKDALINNRGAQQFEVRDFEGNSVAFINTGASIYIYISDNSSQAGAWDTIDFGAITSQAQASALAGKGLLAASSVLNLSITTRNQGHDYTPINADSARVINWTSGVGTLTLSSIASYQVGYVLLVKNSGTGTLTITPTPTDLIDGVASIQLQPDESCFLIASTADANWFAIGQGRSRLFGYTLLTKTLAGGAITLTPQEASATVQIYQGAPATNAVVNLPPVVQVYYVANNTTGTFSTTFQTGGGATVVTEVGDTVLLACDGTNVYTIGKGGSGGGGGGTSFGLSIYQFGCKGNGSTDDTTNLTAALTFAGTVASASVPVDLDFDGGQCAISGQLDIPTGVGMRNGALKAISGGSLSSTVPMVAIDGGNFKRIINMVFDCNRQCAGMSVATADNPVFSRLQIRNFIGYGIHTGAGNTDVQFERVICEEWTVGSAGETDYTQRVAIGWDMQGLNFYMSGCVARYCLSPFKMNASGGGSASISQLYVKNGSSGVTKPNLNGIWITAQGGAAQFSNCIVEDGKIQIDDSFASTSFIGTNHRSTSDSTVTDCFHVQTSTATNKGAGLTIIGSRYQVSLTTFILQQTTGAGSWSTDLDWNIHSNTANGGGIDNPTLQRMVVPTGLITSPGVCMDPASNSGWYRDTGSNVNVGWTAGGANGFKVGLINATWTVGDGTGSPQFSVSGAAGGNRGLEFRTGAANKRWSIYCNNTAEGGSSAGSDLTIGAWDDTGAFIATALTITRATAVVGIPLLKQTPPPTTPPTLANGEMAFVRTSNTVITVFMRGTDGTLRSIALPNPLT